MKILKIGVIVLTMLVGGGYVAQWFSFHRMHIKQSEFLQKRLSEDFGYEGFNRSWLQKAWVLGYRDHTYLFLVTADSSILRDAIELKTGTEPIAGFNLRSEEYLYHTEAPAWWDAATLDGAQARYFEKHGYYWRFTWVDTRLYILCFTT